MNFSGAPEERAPARPIKAQSAAMVRAMASICNAERARWGVGSGRYREFHRLSALSDTPADSKLAISLRKAAAAWTSG